MTNEAESKVRRITMLSVVPWLLAIGLSAWLGLYMTFHQDRKELGQEERMAQYTGAEERPKAKIVIEDKTKDACLFLTQVDYSEPKVLMYAKNDCSQDMDYMEWHWVLVSPNGVALKDGYTNFRCPKPFAHGKAECVLDTRLYFENAETRASKLVVWVQGHP